MQMQPYIFQSQSSLGITADAVDRSNFAGDIQQSEPEAQRFGLQVAM